MKLLFLCIFCGMLLSTTTMVAQDPLLNATRAVARDLDVVHKGRCPIIIPTVKTLKTLGKLSEAEFTKTMLENGYHQDDDFSTHKAIAFTNGNLDPIMLKCLNTYYYNVLNSSIECMVATDMVYPTNIITNLVISLRPYYTVTTNDGYDVFRDGNYIIAIKSDRKFYRIVVSLKQ